MQQGQTLINKDGEKRKILGVCGEMVCVEIKVIKDGFLWMKKKQWEEDGWSPLEEPWRPKNGETVWLVTDAGGFHQAYWNENDLFCKYRLSVGNFHRTREDAEAYKQKLIERMGRKE